MGEADELARRISMDQAHAHAERHMQRAANDLMYWATRMVEGNDRGEIVAGEVRDNLMVALRETQALSQAQAPEAVGWWIGRYLERKAVQLELATGRGAGRPRKSSSHNVTRRRWANTGAQAKEGNR